MEIEKSVFKLPDRHSAFIFRLKPLFSMWMYRHSFDTFETPVYMIHIQLDRHSSSAYSLIAIVKNEHIREIIDHGKYKDYFPNKKPEQDWNSPYCFSRCKSLSEK